MRIIVIGLIISFLSPLYAEDFDKEQILERIKPVGQVNVEGAKESAPVPTVKKVAQPAVKQAPGQAIYEKYCTVCHKDGVAGAPKFRSDEWKPRMAAKNMDALVSSAIKGLNAMPPKGTCQECSEEDIKHAIQYMLPSP